MSADTTNTCLESKSMMSMRIALLSAALVAGMTTVASGQESTPATEDLSWNRLENRSDRREDRRDHREDLVDLAEDHRDRLEDRLDRREDRWDRKHEGGCADRIEDRRDRREDRRDRRH